ncbi:methylated-DNA--[protein]-cysteine S-methyltransferase [Paracoccus sp. PS-1]|uniref:methylated-DNA--[protein]-cysteine S-methyltransferase n=1 Tax=unclassified Paracoccus (in: a-proteobacteria) TaxID=2688777 RepID=UPI0004BC6644|nr:MULTISPECIES: methylated-DNA--[protein]-cysteine S-methyltransferase [unclassified Paracoccus (in: a-proteobacteria)]MDQ7260360.1 methylated-DNA--[protein]-cysteine S-methyltransferase [Paracoccus sp. PS1]
MSVGPDPQADPGALLAALPGPPQGPAELLAAWFDTPLGGMIAVADQERLHLLEFLERAALPAELRRLAARGRIGPGRTAVTDRTEAQIAGYFAGERAAFDLPLVLHGTGFQQQVWRELQRLPAGTTTSYAELARRIGRPSAVRAVARANGANQIAVVIPCHRVIGSDGGLTGYGGGLWRKQALIRHEAEGFRVAKGRAGSENPGEKA